MASAFSRLDAFLAVDSSRQLATAWGPGSGIYSHQIVRSSYESVSVTSVSVSDYSLLAKLVLL